MRKRSIISVLQILLFFICIFIFIRLVEEFIYEKEVNLDNYFISKVSELDSQRLTHLMEIISFTASATFLQISYSILILAFILKKQYKTAIKTFSIAIGGYLINFLMKLAFHRLRPSDPLVEPLSNFSFPSGHATSGFIFYGLIAYLLLKSKINIYLRYSMCIILIAYSLLIGFSRIYLRLHYPSDVVAGFCIGIVWLILMLNLFKKLSPDNNNAATEKMKDQVSA